MSEKGLKWFADAKFGMFFHFGLYTLLGENENQVRASGDKASYAKLMDKFSAKRFDADAWVDCAASMGARYIVPTARHAEGFCLWPSKLTRYTIANTPCKRDLIGELSDACKRNGSIQFSFYFNWETWLNEGIGDDIWNQRGMSYPEFIEGQLTELLTDYGPVGLIWFDHGHETLTRERLAAIHKTLKRLQPDCLLNNRGFKKGETPLGDFRTPEREIPESDPSKGLVLESCDSMGVRSWGFCSNDAFWSVPELARRAGECASKGYNYLLNVEPAPDGSIRKECRERAKGLGAWIAKNKAALLAKPSAVKILDPGVQEHPVIGCCTIEGTKLYAQLQRWPVSSEILLPVEGALKKGRLFGSSSADGLTVGGLPASAPAGQAPWIVEIDFEKAPKALPPPAVRPLEPDPSGTVFLSPLEAKPSTRSGIIIPKINRFPDGRVSMGSLHDIGDVLDWELDGVAGGEYEVHAAFGSIKSQDKAEFELSSPAGKLNGATWLTEHYSKPVTKSVGKLRLAKGRNRVSLRVTGVPSGSFSDIHGIWLVPVRS